MQAFIEKIRNKQESIHNWLKAYEGAKELPLYSSVDIRDAGFKAAVVDTNLFPSGFNNLCEHGLTDSVLFLRDAILKRVENCNNVLIIAEEHTRNTWYLENIRILKQIIEKAGFETTVATFLFVQPEFCKKAHSVELETATGASIKIFCFQWILEQIKSGSLKFDLIILNNDLTSGIPEVLKSAQAPIYPSLQAGWHSRLKSRHFRHAVDLNIEFGRIIGVDPWFFSCLDTVVDQVNINSEEDRNKILDATSDLLKRIQAKYNEHQIDEKPFIFIKADAGTYGMGVMPIEDPHDILKLNRKNRNRLFKGKGSQVIDRYLIQEGVPTIYHIEQQVSEVVIYQIANNLVGGFYRSHGEKSNRENLNTQGMAFKKMCPHLSKYGDCGVHHDVSIFDLYRILARIAGVAAHREIIQLETVTQ